MPHLPTKHVGPGGVQRVEPSSDCEYIGEDHDHGPGQQVVIYIQVDGWPETYAGGHLCRRMMRITMRIEFCVAMQPCFAQVTVYEFEAPYDDRTTDRAKHDIKCGHALRGKDWEFHDPRGLHYDRNKPFDVMINDPANVLSWLGADFAANAAREQQKQLPSK